MPSPVAVSWAQVQVPVGLPQAAVSWAQLQIPDSHAGARVSWAQIIVPHSDAANVIATSTIPWLTGGGVIQRLPLWYEANQALAPQPPLPWEARVTVSPKTGQVPWEALAAPTVSSVTKAVAVVWEAGIGLRLVPLLPVEALAQVHGLHRGAGGLIYFFGDERSWLPRVAVFWESRPGVNQTLALPYEARQALVQTLLGGWEAGGGIARSVGFPYEAPKLLAVPLASPYEVVSVLGQILRMPSESGTRIVQVGNLMPYESKVGLARLVVDPWEATGVAVVGSVTKTVQIAWEAPRGVLNALAEYWEALQGGGVDPGIRTLFYEAGAPLAWATTFPLEALDKLAAAPPLPWETTSDLRRVGAPLAWESRVLARALAQAVWESRGGSRFVVVIPWEADGVTGRPGFVAVYDKTTATVTVIDLAVGTVNVSDKPGGMP